MSVAGIDHVGLGIDYYLGQHFVADDAQALSNYEREKAAGRWAGSDYPAPPHRYPERIETPRTLPNLTRGLLRRGYSAEQTKAILGLNWLRLYEAGWG
ncbi:membrane dipeptidase [Candidatus Poriferisodalis sp.]|uniref:membrane dipeptidase n=1 Tax=Candidatus Poriferisodalis sp. TaxID=3101277 RepID=UPI003B51CE8B